MELEQATLRLLDVMLKDDSLQTLMDEAAHILERPVWVMDVALRHLTDPSHVYPYLQALLVDYQQSKEKGREATLYVYQTGHIEGLGREDLYLHYNDLLEDNVLGAAVRIKGIIVAYVFTCENGRPFQEGDKALMKKLRELCSLSLQRTQGTQTGNRSLPSRLLYELLDKQVELSPQIHNQAQALGITFAPYSRMILLFSDNQWGETLPWFTLGIPFINLFGNCVHAVYQNHLVLVVSQEHEFSDYQWKRLQELLQDSGLKAAVSRYFNSLEETYIIYRDTLLVLQCGEKSYPQQVCYIYEDLIPLLIAHRLKGSIPVSALAGGALEKLRAYDKEYDQLSFENTKTYVKCSFDLNRAADEMHVHKNTMRYRIARTEEITGLDLTQWKTMLELTLAFIMDELEN